MNLIKRGYPETLVSTTLAEIAFEERKPALQQKVNVNKTCKSCLLSHNISANTYAELALNSTTTVVKKNIQISLYSFEQKGQIPRGYTCTR